MKTLPFTAPLLIAVLAAPAARAQQSYPMLMSITPVAVQAGTTTECEVEARYSLHGTYQVFVTGDGVTGEVDPPAALKPGEKRPQVNRLKVSFKAAPDALLGVRDVRLATPLGASTLGQIVVVRDPVVRETTSNHDSMKTAQPIPVPCTLCGAIQKREDVDYYKLTVAAGTALTFHVRCHRLQNRIHDLQEMADPILTLRNSSGAVVAANDNYFTADPLLHHRFDRGGDYYLEVRDVRYLGNRYWNYCIEIHDRPFVTNVYPHQVTPGKPTRLQLIGYNLPADPTVTLALPADTPDGVRRVLLPLPDGQTSNDVPVLVSRLPEVHETPGDKSTPQKAQAIAVPAGVSGRLDQEGEVDCYAFEARAGERFTFAVVAQDCQAQLDSVLRVLNDKGQPLIENDDAAERYAGSDSRIENWAAPASGRYILEVRDLHQRGGPRFGYVLQAVRASPHFTLQTDTDKTPLAPGTANVLYVRAIRREGFQGDIQLGIDGLPPGVTAVCGRILDGQRDGCIILQAAPDAKPAAANVRVWGTATVKGPDDKPVALTATARQLQEFYSPGGGRGHYPVELHTVSVGEPLDIRSVKLSTPAVTLKPGESKTVEVTIERGPGFTANVTLAAFYQHLNQIFGSTLPPGVTVDEKASQTLLTAGQVKGSITLRAAPDAKPAADQLVPVMAHVSINFVMKFTYAAPLRVTVVGK